MISTGIHYVYVCICTTTGYTSKKKIYSNDDDDNNNNNRPIGRKKDAVTNLIMMVQRQFETIRETIEGVSSQMSFGKAEYTNLNKTDPLQYTRYRSEECKYLCDCRDRDDLTSYNPSDVFSVALVQKF